MFACGGGGGVSIPVWGEALWPCRFVPFVRSWLTYFYPSKFAARSRLWIIHSSCTLPYWVLVVGLGFLICSLLNIVSIFAWWWSPLSPLVRSSAESGMGDRTGVWWFFFNVIISAGVSYVCVVSPSPLLSSGASCMPRCVLMVVGNVLCRPPTFFFFLCSFVNCWLVFFLLFAMLVI